MRWLLLGALLGLLLVLCPSVVLAVAANSLVVAFGVGFAVRPTVARSVRRWAP
ncbi:hypothetical protein ACIP79_08140 [Streptomyces sp. NPDC088747]|uniref:hypothetical protein n=1 Tax=Streptomyces sp. NPDC088747 TaxID=3365886 RepID=UPI0037FDEED9